MDLTMDVKKQIRAYIDSLPEPKRTELLELHKLALRVFPKGKLWFLDGRNGEGKVVSNPNIGHGLRTIRYANGKTKEFYQIGLSANSAGISVYIMGIEDKKLPAAYGKKIGKASVSGYCIKFKALKDIRMEILEAAMREAAG